MACPADVPLLKEQFMAASKPGSTPASAYQRSAPGVRPFARTNPQTIAQRAKLLQELVPQVQRIAELCCGDCIDQWRVYTQQLGVKTYCGLDLEPGILKLNQSRGIPCVCGDVMSPSVLEQFLGFDVIFYGPPLSVACDGHQLLDFRAVVPGFGAFVEVLLHQLQFQGLLVCICPNTTTMGDISQLYQQIQAQRPDVHLRLIHHSFSTITGYGDRTEPRRKYIELWFSPQLPDVWEVRESPAGE